MTTHNANAQIVEIVNITDFRLPFLLPLPVSPKRKQLKKTTDYSIELKSVLKKRKYDNAFNDETYDDERYDQHINSDFFANNIGHAVQINTQHTFTTTK